MVGWCANAGGQVLHQECVVMLMPACTKIMLESTLGIVKSAEAKNPSLWDATVMMGRRSTHGIKMMRLSTSEGLLINDIVFEEDDWSIMGATPFTQLHEAWQYILARSTCCSIVIYDYQGLWMRLLYHFLELFHCMQQVGAARAYIPNKQLCEH